MKISTTQQSVNQKKFDDNFDRIFGKDKPIERGSFTQAADGKMVPRGTVQTTKPMSAAVHAGFEEFQSPIDKKTIASRGQLAAHNKQHGVTNSSDYSDGYIEKRRDKRINEGERKLKQSRTQDIHRAAALIYDR